MSSEEKAKKGMTRRDFFMGAAVAGATVAGLGSLTKIEAASGSALMECDNAETGTLKYDKYIAKDVVRKNQWGGEGIGLTAGKDVIPPDARMNLGITIVRKPYMFHEPTHKHLFTEFFFFFGSNPMDMNEFDADVEYTFVGDHEETYFLNICRLAAFY